MTTTAGNRRTDHRIPGPSRVATPRLLTRMVRDRLDVMSWAATTYGDAVRLPLGPKTLHLFNHPEYAKHVLADNAGNYTKGIGMTHAKRALGEGLLTSDGELWRAQRKVVHPAFQAKRIAAQVGAVSAEAEKLVARLRTMIGGGTTDIRDEMTAFTLGVLGHTLLDTDLGRFDTIGESFEAVQNQAMFEMMSLNTVPLWLPLPRQRRFRAAKKDIQRIVDTLASDSAKRTDGDGSEIMARLTASARQEPDPRVARVRVRDQLVTLLLAGHETTASTLSWAFYLIDRHPEVWEQLHDEAVRAFSAGPLTTESLHGLTYTTKVLEEVMRLYPPVWLLPRIARADDEIGGYRVPSGADVLISPYLLHRHPEFWPAPGRFDPERFDPAASKGRDRYAYIPFGAGPRFCVGSNLALLEATVVLVTVARDVRLKKDPDHKVVGEPMLTLRIRGGLPMTVHPAGRPLST